MKKNKINKNNILFVNLQIILTIAVIIMFIVYMFNKKYFMWLELVLSLALLVMGYNNQVIYKRKNATILYVFVGTLLLILFILSLFGVIV